MIIERSINDSQHYCHFNLTKERFVARLGGDDLALFMNKQSMDEYPDACPFLRPCPEGFYCTIYSFRPSHCRNFVCV